MAELIFNAESVPTSDVIPGGEYPVQLVESDVRDTNAGNGSYLSCTLDIIDGPHEGRKLFDRITLSNPSEAAVQIGQKKLSQICHAVGVTNITKSEQLHSKPLLAVVRVRPAGPDRNGIERDAQNDIRSYKPLPNGGLPAAAAPAGTLASRTTGPWAA